MFPYFWCQTSSVEPWIVIRIVSVCQGSTADGGRLTPKIWKQKEGFQHYLKYTYNSILNIIPLSRYRALDLDFAKKRVHNTGYEEEWWVHFAGIETFQWAGPVLDIMPRT